MMEKWCQAVPGFAVVVSPYATQHSGPFQDYLSKFPVAVFLFFSSFSFSNQSGLFRYSNLNTSSLLS
jgi:hypothetical protein